MNLNDKKRYNENLKVNLVKLKNSNYYKADLNY